MTTGTVKWINERKGFGLIAPDGGGQHLFARFWTLPAGAPVQIGEGKAEGILLRRG
jgi:cold shock CspA family protein